MKFKELINKSLTGEFEVYSNTDDILNSRIKLFDSNFDILDSVKLNEYQENLKKYANYEVVWYAPMGFINDRGFVTSYLKIVIEEPKDETKLPF